MQAKARNPGCSVVRNTKTKATTKPQDMTKLSRNARDFGYLVFQVIWPDSRNEWDAALAWHVREWDGQFVSEHMTLNEAKQKCLEYEEAIREKAWELESVQAFNRAKQYDTFAANWILRNSCRILPKLVALNLL